MHDIDNNKNVSCLQTKNFVNLLAIQYSVAYVWRLAITPQQSTVLRGLIHDKNKSTTSVCGLKYKYGHYDDMNQRLLLTLRHNLYIPVSC